jgi:hypothetical protein
MTRLVPVAIVSIGLAAGRCFALISIDDLNSHYTFYPLNSSYGVAWNVDGVLQADFAPAEADFFRVGATSEHGVWQQGDGLGFWGDTDPAVDPSFDSVQFMGFGDTIQRSYTLRGGTTGSRRSDLLEQVVISNPGTSPLDFHYFHYAHFRLGMTSDDALQWNPTTHVMRQADANSIMTEVIGGLQPSLIQVGAFEPTAFGLIDDPAGPPSPTTLTGAAGPVGPGDVAWAMEWDMTIPAGGFVSFAIDDTISPVPAPGASILGLVLPAALFRRRR